jgi:stress-induced morphogen
MAAELYGREKLMPLPAPELHKILLEKFPGADIHIENLANDNDHYRVHIKSSAFTGKSRVEQHRMVTSALRGTPGETIHALSLVTKA